MDVHAGGMSIEDCSALFSVFTGNRECSQPVPCHANNHNSASVQLQRLIVKSLFCTRRHLRWLPGGQKRRRSPADSASSSVLRGKASQGRAGSGMHSKVDYCKTSRRIKRMVEIVQRISAQTSTTISACSVVTGTQPAPAGVQAITPSSRLSVLDRKPGKKLA